MVIEQTIGVCVSKWRDILGIPFKKKCVVLFFEKDFTTIDPSIKNVIELTWMKLRSADIHCSGITTVIKIQEKVY